MPDDVVQIQVTHPDRGSLETLVGELVDTHAIASANILGPLTSTYIWDRKTQHTEEWLALMKTTRAKMNSVIIAIAEGHPYEVPGIITANVDDGFALYLDWIRETTK